MLRILTNALLSTSAVRDDLLNEGALAPEDHCRVCHKLGKYNIYLENLGTIVEITKSQLLFTTISLSFFLSCNFMFIDNAYINQNTIM